MSKRNKLVLNKLSDETVNTFKPSTQKKMSTKPVNQSSAKQTYQQQPPPVHQCQCNRSSFGLHLFILFALIGSAGFFWLSTGGIEVVRQKNQQPSKDHMLTSDSLKKYIMQDNAPKISKKEVGKVKKIPNETINKAKNVEAEPDNHELVNKEILESPPEEIQPDPASMLFGVVSRIRESRNQQ
jgi:hypothetical protein